MRQLKIPFQVTRKVSRPGKLCIALKMAVEGQVAACGKCQYIFAHTINNSRITTAYVVNDIGVVVFIVLVR